MGSVLWLWEAFLFQTVTALIHSLYPSFVNKLPPECRAILPHWRRPDQSGRCTVLWLLGSSLWWPPGHTESAWVSTGDQRTLSPGTCPPCSQSRSRPQLCCLGTGSDESPEAGQKMQVDKRTASHLDQSWKQSSGRSHQVMKLKTRLGSVLTWMESFSMS